MSPTDIDLVLTVVVAMVVCAFGAFAIMVLPWQHDYNHDYEYKPGEDGGNADE